jgi:hypothetical protein
MPDIAQTGAVLVCSDGTGAAPITGAPAAYCFDIHTHRASRTVPLGAPKHHRYVRVLDWKVSLESAKTRSRRVPTACKFKQVKELIFIFKNCERLTRVVRNSLCRPQAAS